MLHEASEELARTERRTLAMPSPKANGLAADGQQAVVGDRGAVGVAAQVAKDVLGATEGRLGVDDPGFSI